MVIETFKFIYGFSYIFISIYLLLSCYHCYTKMWRLVNLLIHCYIQYNNSATIAKAAIAMIEKE